MFIPGTKSSPAYKEQVNQDDRKVERGQFSGSFLRRKHLFREKAKVKRFYFRHSDEYQNLLTKIRLEILNQACLSADRFRMTQNISLSPLPSGASAQAGSRGEMFFHFSFYTLVLLTYVDSLLDTETGTKLTMFVLRSVLDNRSLIAFIVAIPRAS